MIPVQGYAAQITKAPLAPYNFTRRDVGAHDVLIDIQYCGVCHSDIHQVREEWGGAFFPMVPGHEIVGIVSGIGNAVQNFKIGEWVGVGCFVDSCRHCTNCKKGLEQFCCEGKTKTYNDMERDGSRLTQGGYSTKIVVDENYILKIPANLPKPATAPLLCAGITIYSSLKHWNAGPGKQIAILGLGGLGHMGVKMASAMGAEVTVFSHSCEKEADAKRFGASHFYSATDSNMFEKLNGTFDLILNTLSVELDWDRYIKLLNHDGTLIILGIPGKSVTFDPFSLILARRSLAGSLIGGIKETQEMLDFCAEHQIASDIELIPIQQVNEAFDRVLKSDVRYRFVLDISTLKDHVL